MSAEGTQRYLATKVLMMPRDTNPQGTIFGGVLLSYIDQAGAAGARFEMMQAGWPESSIVTVAVNGVEVSQARFCWRPREFLDPTGARRADVDHHTGYRGNGSTG